MTIIVISGFFFGLFLFKTFISSYTYTDYVWVLGLKFHLSLSLDEKEKRER